MTSPVGGARRSGTVRRHWRSTNGAVCQGMSSRTEYGSRALVAPDVQHVAHALGRDHAGPRAVVLEDGVRRDRRPVQDAVEARRLDPGAFAELEDARDERAAGVVGRRVDLVDLRAAVLGVVQREVRERAADVDAYESHGRPVVVAGVNGRPTAG